MPLIRTSPVFDRLLDAALAKPTPRYIASEGGARSGKTISALQLLDILVERDKPGDVTSVVSESLPHLRKGAIRDFEAHVIGKPLKDCAEWNASTLTYTYPSGGTLEFFSVDSPQKVQGPGRKRLFANEANHITYETFRQLVIRTTGLVMFDYNPESMFWGIETIEPRPNCTTIHSTYKDNPFLPQALIDEIEANKGDTNWWKVYGLGQLGSLEGQIYDFTLIDELPTGDEATSLVSLYGMDFGFTNDPTAIVHLLVDTRRKVIYADELCYRTRMLNGDIADTLRLAGLTRQDTIYADCAEPKSIAEISLAGFTVLPCSKTAPGKDALSFQLQWMKGWDIRVTKRSTNLIKEGRTCVWAKDRDGHNLNKPEPGNDHALDAMRYAAWTRFGQNANYGQYSIHIVR